MSHALRIRADIVTPRQLSDQERRQLAQELQEWTQLRVMRLGGCVPTQVYVQPQEIPVTSFGMSREHQQELLHDAG